MHGNSGSLWVSGPLAPSMLQHACRRGMRCRHHILQPEHQTSTGLQCSCMTERESHHGRRDTLTEWLLKQSICDVADGFEVMVSRIAGIVGGTLVSLLVAVTVYPSSATQELLESLKEALKGLCELDRAAVQEAAHALGHVSRPDDSRCG